MLGPCVGDINRSFAGDKRRGGISKEPFAQKITRAALLRSRDPRTNYQRAKYIPLRDVYDNNTWTGSWPVVLPEKLCQDNNFWGYTPARTPWCNGEWLKCEPLLSCHGVLARISFGYTLSGIFIYILICPIFRNISFVKEYSTRGPLTTRWKVIWWEINWRHVMNHILSCCWSLFPTPPAPLSSSICIFFLNYLRSIRVPGPLWFLSSPNHSCNIKRRGWSEAETIFYFFLYIPPFFNVTCVHWRFLDVMTSWSPRGGDFLFYKCYINGMPLHFGGNGRKFFIRAQWLTGLELSTLVVKNICQGSGPVVDLVLAKLCFNWGSVSPCTHRVISLEYLRPSTYSWYI